MRDSARTRQLVDAAFGAHEPYGDVLDDEIWTLAHRVEGTPNPLYAFPSGALTNLGHILGDWPTDWPAMLVIPHG